MSTEAKELELLGKVEFRIALADSDSKLETLLKTYLAPVLLKLASDHLSVRNKVIAICGHINTRIRPQSIQLPVAALLKQFKEHSTPLIRHFDSVYIQQGVSRLPEGELVKLLPDLISGIVELIDVEALQGAQLFHVLLRILNFYSIPPRGTKEDGELRSTLRVSDQDGAFLAFWFGKLILFTLPPRAATANVPEKSLDASRPGLSNREFKFLSLHHNEQAWNISQGGLKLDEIKVKIAKLFATGLFNDDERFLAAIYASANSNSRISEIGEDVLKRISLDLDPPSVANTLFDVYLCTGSAKDCTPLPPSVRIKLLLWLSKSAGSVSFTEHVVLTVKAELGVADTGPHLVLSQPGREANKLHTALLNFVQSLVRGSQGPELPLIAKELMDPMKHYIENQGWPTADQDQDISSRGHCYEIIGLLAKAAKEPNLSLLKWLFTSLEEDVSSNIALSIDEAISHTIDTFRNLQSSEKHEFEKLLTQSIEPRRIDSKAENSRIIRKAFAAVRFANRCLPFSNVCARKIDTIAAGFRGEKDTQDIVAEGKRGLNPANFEPALLGKKLEFPPFDELLDSLLSSSEDNDWHTKKAGDTSAFSMIEAFANGRPNQFSVAIRFLRLILYEETAGSDQTPSIDADWERKVLSLLTDENARNTIKTNIREKKKSQDLPLLLHSAFRLTATEMDEAPGFFIELYSLTGDIIPPSALPNYIQELETLIFSNNLTTRIVAARTSGILVSLAANSGMDVQPFVEKCFQSIGGWETAAGAAVNRAHGAILTLAYFFTRLSQRGSLSQEWKPALSKLVTAALSMLKSSDKTLKEASYSALGQLSLFHVLGQPLLAMNDSSSKSSYIDISNLILESAKTSDEKAILALGRFGMIASEETESLKHVIDGLHSLHEIKQMEAQFTVGEAISCAASGWSSKAVNSELDIDGPTPLGPRRGSALAMITDQTIKDCKAPKPSLRKASVIWLLCLLEYCGHNPELHERLSQCQSAFKSCLADKDDLVQEAASRGLGLVYEKGDRELKDALVRDLVTSFSSENKPQLAGNVTEDTQLFEPGALPTGEGSSITTYKDILNLASEVGDSSLVYRFMSMASSSAIWSSRAAFGRFGLSNVFANADIDDKLIVKLYRYRFDPNPNVRRAMNQIWNAIVQDSTSAIENNLDKIMEDLLKSVVDGREWRTREASCAALADLVQGRRLEKYEEYLDQIWTQCFKVMDDIKGTVRTAAFSLARVLTGILTKSLEVESTSSKNAEALLKRVIPFLLSGSGIESSAKEVQVFAIVTLLDIIKKGGRNNLRPFIPELLERLIGLHSSLEPEAVNYLHLNASKYNTTETEIDDQRLKMVRMSPITEAIERCLDRLDDTSMAETAPRLEHAMKVAIGLPSKVACSRVLVSLSTRHNLIFRPFADRFLRLIEKLILDRNDTVSSSYAAAGGYVARLSSDRQLLQTVSFAYKLYFQSDDPRGRIIAGDLIYAISKHATDRFMSVATEILPFVFVAKHDSEEQVHESFERTWSENVGGSRSVMLYLKEIIALSQQYLDSPKWVLKHASARSVAEAVGSTASTIEDISVSNAETLWPAIEKAMSGKTWEGKEVVLNAFVRFVERGSQLWKAKPAVAAEIRKIAVREAKRQNKEYRPFAIRALGQVAAARTDIDLSQTIVEVLQPVIEELSSEDVMEVDGEPGAKRAKLENDTIIAMILTLADGVQPTIQSDIQSVTSSTIKLIVSAQSCGESSKPAIRSAVFQAYETLFGKLQTLPHSASPPAPADVTALTENISQTLINAADARLSESIRLKRAEAVTALARISWRTVAVEVVSQWLSQEVEVEKSVLVKAELEKARKALA